MGLDDHSTVEVPSTFPSESAPILFPLNAHLNHDFLKKERIDDLMLVVKEIERIANNHRSQKGVVHFSSYKWKRAVMNRLSEGIKERAVSHTSDDRKEVLEEFLKSKNPNILFSVKIDEGTDFKDDLARWQIIVKAPYPDLSDLWIKRHYERMGKEWYDISTLQGIIQASGRIMRSKDDWGTTYILDRNALTLIYRYRDRCPKWFLDRVVDLSRDNHSRDEIWTLRKESQSKIHSISKSVEDEV